MKRLLTALMLVVALLAGGATADAKTTKKKSTSTSASSAVKIQTDSEGNPIIWGHTYTGRGKGMSIKLMFVSPEQVNMIFSDGRSESYFEAYWYQDGDLIYISGEEDEPFQITNGGKTLYDVVNRVTLKAIK